MPGISVGAALASGFGLIRRKPLAVLVWGCLLIAGLAVVLAAYATFVLTMFSFTSAEHGAGGSNLPPEVVAQQLGRALMGEGAIFLAFLVFLAARVVSTVAVWRAVLHPEQQRWAYLRLGVRELLVLLMMVAVGLMANVAVFALVPFMLIAGALLALHQWAAAAVVGAIGVMALVAIAVYLELRFALIGPMIVDDGRLHFVDAWSLTRGRVVSLLKVGLGLVAIVIGLELIVVLLALLLFGAAIGLAGGFANPTAFARQQPAVILGELAPALALLLVLGIPLAGALIAVVAAPWAKAYRDVGERAAPAPPAPDLTPVPAPA